jgi:hypothetical protein
MSVASCHFQRVSESIRLQSCQVVASAWILKHVQDGAAMSIRGGFC